MLTFWPIKSDTGSLIDSAAAMEINGNINQTAFGKQFTLSPWKPFSSHLCEFFDEKPSIETPTKRAASHSQIVINNSFLTEVD